MWLEYIIRFATLCVIGITAYFLGYDNGSKDAQRKAKEKYDKDFNKWIDERCDLISEIIELKNDSKHEHYLTD